MRRFLQLTDLLRSTVALLPEVQQPVAAVGSAVGVVRTGHVEQTGASGGQDHLLEVVGTAAAEVPRAAAGNTEQGGSYR